MAKATLGIFRWQARNTLGEKEKGILIAKNVEQAKKQLFQRGLTPMRVYKNYGFHSPPSLAEISDVFNTLSVLLLAKIPLKTALQLLLQNCQHLQIYRWLTQLIQDLNAGFSFSQALSKQNLYTNTQEIQLIRVGELTGKLASLCGEIAKNKQQKLALQRKIQKILLYPIMVLGIALCLTLALLLFVVPQFAQMYANHPNALPLMTKALLFLSQFLWDHGVILTTIIGIFSGAVKIFLPAFLPKIVRDLLAHAPIFSQLFPLIRLHFVAENLAIMLKAGIPLKDALQSFLSQEKNTDDPILRKEIRHIIKCLSQGYAFSASLGTATFPLQAQQMIQVGEKTGNLVLMLENIANDAKNKLTHRIDLLSQLLEPALMLMIGGLIGLTMLGMYLPIFDMGAMV